MNLAGIFIIIIFYFLICKLLKNSKYNEKKYIENIENSLFQEEDINSIEKIYNNLNNLSYRHIKVENFKKTLLYFFTIIICLFLSSFQEEISINFVFFYFFIFIYVIKNLEIILNFQDNIDSLNFYKSLYYYYSRKN